MTEDISSLQKFKLKKLVRELEQYRARHTELITVYISSGYDIVKVIQQLQQEQGTAINIKSKGTRKNVLAALERMVQHLRLYKKTPANGLAVFSGNIAEQEGAQDIRVWGIEPTLPLKVRAYRCDQAFFLDPLKDLLLPKKAYGLVVIDNREANVAVLKGKAILPVSKMGSMIPGKFKAGGQSAARFSRVREGMKKDFYKKVGDIVNENLDKPEIVGIILGGPGPTKDSFHSGAFMSQSVKNKIVAVKDIGYTGEEGLQELVTKSEDVLAKEEIAIEKKIMNEFFTRLNTRSNLVSYGEAEVKKAIEMGAVSDLLISEQLDERKVEPLIEANEQFKGELHIISTETTEGSQLASMGGVAALLRFPIS